MPSEWDHASLENVKVGENVLDLYYERQPANTSIKVVQEIPEWELLVKVPDITTESIEIMKGIKTQDGKDTIIRADSNGLVEIKY